MINICSNTSTNKIDLCGLSADINALINELKLSKMRIRNNLADIHPVTVNALYNVPVRTTNTLRDYTTTGRNNTSIIIPKQPGFPQYAFYGTRINASLPGALIETNYMGGIWWMVDRCVMASYSAKTSPYFTLYLSWTPQDADGLVPLSIADITVDTGGTVTVTGYNFTNNMSVYFNNILGEIIDITIDNEDLTALCSMQCTVPDDTAGNVDVLVRNLNLGNNGSATTSFVYS